MGKLTELSLEHTTAVIKLNCWEHKKCGRQPGGHRTAEMGVCPAATHVELNSAHSGKNAGRACWVVAGSLCGGKLQGTYAKKLLNCWRCDFMNMVKREEDSTQFGFSHTRLGMERAIDKQTGRMLEPFIGSLQAAAAGKQE